MRANLGQLLNFQPNFRFNKNPNNQNVLPSHRAQSKYSARETRVEGTPALRGNFLNKSPKNHDTYIVFKFELKEFNKIKLTIFNPIN